MKCTECGNVMSKSVGDHVYRESGMDHVILRNITKYNCEQCGAKRIQIIAMAKLHRAIASALATKPARLLPSEVRFLRDHLELSNRDFAALMGVSEEQSSRWVKSEPVGVPAERFLRVLAIVGPDILAQRHATGDLADALKSFEAAALVRTLGSLPTKDEPARELPIKVRRNNSDWKSEVQASPN